MGVGQEASMPSQAVPLPHQHPDVLTKPGALQSPSFTVFLWRFHYAGIIDYIIGYW